MVLQQLAIPNLAGRGKRRSFRRGVRRPAFFACRVGLLSLFLQPMFLLCVGCAPVRPTEDQAITSAKPRVDLVVVDKSERRLSLLSAGTVFRQYPISLGKNPVGHKTRKGDRRTPEGRYVLDWRNPHSAYYKSLHISYPSRADAALSRANGHDPGGMVMIHGLPNGEQSPAVRATYSRIDWTNGCIAMHHDAHMDELWRLVPDGTVIHIVP